MAELNFLRSGLRIGQGDCKDNVGDRLSWAFDCLEGDLWFFKIIHFDWPTKLEHSRLSWNNFFLLKHSSFFPKNNFFEEWLFKMIFDNQKIRAISLWPKITATHCELSLSPSLSFWNSLLHCSNFQNLVWRPIMDDWYTNNWIIVQNLQQPSLAFEATKFEKSKLSYNRYIM